MIDKIQFSFQIGRLDQIVVVDCTEQYMRDNMSSGEEAKLDEFRMNTLPVISYYDDRGITKVVGILFNLDFFVVDQLQRLYALWTLHFGALFFYLSKITVIC